MGSHFIVAFIPSRPKQNLPKITLKRLVQVNNLLNDIHASHGGFVDTNDIFRSLNYSQKIWIVHMFKIIILRCKHVHWYGQARVTASDWKKFFVDFEVVNMLILWRSSRLKSSITCTLCQTLEHPEEFDSLFCNFAASTC